MQSLEISSSPSASFESVPIGSFWDELRAIFEWLHGVAVAARLAPFPIAGTVERERIFQTSGDVCLIQKGDPPALPGWQ